MKILSSPSSGKSSLCCWRWWCLTCLLLSAVGVDAETAQANATTYNVIPVDKSDDPPITDLLYLDIRQKLSRDSDDSRPMGTIVIGLFGTIVPKTVENFKRLAPVYERKHTLFHKVIKHLMIQTGDIDNRGGHSIYGKRGARPPKGADLSKFGPLYSGLEDESFAVSGFKLGRVSAVNEGPNTGGSQFFICMGTKWRLGGKYVVFGQVIRGMDVAEEISLVPRGFREEPILDIFIQTARTEPYTEGQFIKSSASEIPPFRPSVGSWLPVCISFIVLLLIPGLRGI